MVGIWSCGWPVRLEEVDSEVFRAPLGALPDRPLAMTLETPVQAKAPRIISLAIACRVGALLNSTECVDGVWRVFAGYVNVIVTADIIKCLDLGDEG